MSKASPQVINYLQQQLSRNPVSESDDIISLRTKAFKLEQRSTSPAAKPTPPSADRQRLREKLEKIRSQCFTGTIDELQKQIARLPLADHPDLLTLANRLQVVLDSRAKLPALSADPRFDGDFFSCLKKVLVEPPREVSVLREQVLSSFRHRSNRKRGQAMIRLLKERLPALYALEHDWLESLLRMSGRSATASSYAAPQRSSPYVSSDVRSQWPVWLLVFLAGPLIRGCIRISNMSDSPKKTRSSYSAPANSPAAEEVNAYLAKQRQMISEMQAEQQESWRSNDFNAQNDRPLPGGFARPRVAPMPSTPRPTIPSSPGSRAGPSPVFSPSFSPPSAGR